MSARSGKVETNKLREDAGERQRLLSGLAAYSSAQSEMGRQFARHMGMHVTDSAALVEILRAEERTVPLTPARLGEKIALTSGATSILLNRLEEAGHVTRQRGHADRRRVTLHSSPAVHAEAEAFFSAQRQAVEDFMSRYSGQHITLIEEFVTNLAALINEHPDSANT